MRVGLVCPYSLDVAGGVQRHVLDLAEHLIADGHHVRVLAPASAATSVPPSVDVVGGSLAVPYNGSVARISFGPLTAARVGSWQARGRFDLLHLHQPVAPSLSLLSLRAARAPVVATWHTAQERSRAMQLGRALLAPALERIDAHVAVSEDARRTVVDHLGGDALVIPNGVDVAATAGARREPAWCGARFGGPPTVVLVGRFDEPRKGAGVLAAALPALAAAHPGLRLLVAGRGDGAALAASAGVAAGAVRVLGELDEDDKRALMASADVVVAPQRGGESFGIVLVEAMAAGTPLVASDLPAFSRVLGGGRLGTMFATGDSRDLARAVRAVLDDPAAAAARAAVASAEVVRYDWSVVAASVSAVYDTVLDGHRALAAPALAATFADRASRLHRRVDASAAALDRALARRRAAALHWCERAGDGPEVAALALVAGRGRDESALTRALAAALPAVLPVADHRPLLAPAAVPSGAAPPSRSDLPSCAPSPGPTAGRSSELAALAAACQAVVMARRFANDAAARAAAARTGPVVRRARLAGSAPMPATVEIDDEVPPVLLAPGAWR